MATRTTTTLISHVEPFDLANFAQARLLLGLPVGQVQRPVQPGSRTPRAPQDRARLLGDAQKLLADDAVHAFPYQPQWITVANKNSGLWRTAPVFVNDLGPAPGARDRHLLSRCAFPCSRLALRHGQEDAARCGRCRRSPAQLPALGRASFTGHGCAAQWIARDHLLPE